MVKYKITKLDDWLALEKKFEDEVTIENDYSPHSENLKNSAHSPGKTIPETETQQKGANLEALKSIENNSPAVAIPLGKSLKRKSEGEHSSSKVSKKQSNLNAFVKSSHIRRKATRTSLPSVTPQFKPIESKTKESVQVAKDPIRNCDDCDYLYDRGCPTSTASHLKEHFRRMAKLTLKRNVEFKALPAFSHVVGRAILIQKNQSGVQANTRSALLKFMDSIFGENQANTGRDVAAFVIDNRVVSILAFYSHSSAHPAIVENDTDAVWRVDDKKVEVKMCVDRLWVAPIHRKKGSIGKT